MKTRSIFLIAAVLLVAVLAFTSCDLISQYLPGDKHEHTWQDATCTSPRTCTSCNATEGEPLGHTEEVVAGKEASCSEKGLTEGKKCSLCGEILVAQQETPIKDHTEETVPGSDASCTETGLTEGKRCADCGITLVEQQEIPLKDHTEEIIPGKDATCTDNGLTEGKKCSVCGETLVPREEIPPVAHTEEVVPGRAPTCTETGLTEGKHCSVCGEVLKEQETVKALGHVAGETVVKNNVDPTCTATGSYDNVVYCTVCNKELSRETVTVDALGHTEVIDEAKAPTCTETGLTAGKHCSVCDKVLEAQEVIDALGHKAGEVVIENLKAPTCVAEGSYDEVVYCTVCDAELSRNTVITNATGVCEYEATGIWGVGNKTYFAKITCKNCDFQTSVQATITTEYFEGDCQNRSYTNYIATFSEANLEKYPFLESAEKKVYGSTGDHVWSYTATADTHSATCTVDGCGETLAKTPHDFSEGECVCGEAKPIEVNAIGIDKLGETAEEGYSVRGSVVTVYSSAACKLGYLENGAYVALDAVQNADGSYSFTAPEGVSEVLLVIIGDVDGDGDVDEFDIDVLATSLMPAGEALTAEQYFAADVNGNGAVNSADRVYIARSLLDTTNDFYRALSW